MTPSGRLVAGRYRTEEQLGQGGFGVVFRALDASTGRPVALKMLREARLDEATRSRFDREARVVQQLTHPNTVRVHDFGADSDGTPFIAYELLVGETLSQIIRRGPISLERTRRIGAQVLEALAEAHSLGIVHRDIKPGNIMVLQPPGDRDVVKVLDFGIAKPTLAATKVLTATGAVMGTPRFMSPEQVNGAPVRPASDVYSMGLLLTEMLSGSRVFDGPAFDVMMAQLSDERVPLPPLVAASPLRSVIARAVEKDPAKRFADAAQMLEAMRSGGGARALPVTLDTSDRVPPVAPAPSSGRGLALPVALIVGFGALVLAVLTAAAGLAWYLGSLPAPRAASGGASPAVGLPSPAPAKNPTSLETPLDAQLPTLDVKALVEVLEKDGWTENDRDLQLTEGTLSFIKGERSAVVTYTVYVTATEAEQRGQIANGTYAAARFGTTVASFMVVHGKLSTKESTELRDVVVKQLRARHK